ncbi:alpha/beta-hydrolase [Aaosphaeria arxii CBS 175.79]|uniref:Alpha/beta-hydrolase n=1 Tax=Aaosphaeria arxii CBS 175.79 TaxID=1450172 RepID=A0A6A5XQJ8_9PLEO|nr:alpha/beta-hydrolase [Aaosphaeria arxii CBS 175.79]KAF2015442.1 alpha/beta-hydrolase [Aaosphaeria arxii CBS 175.79]
MSLQPIEPDDSRIEHKTAVLNGLNYHYLYAVPPGGQFNATVFLIHGWPDLSLGWRYQIPQLLGMGLRVVAPDLMGFGGTDAPKVPPNPINLYGLKRASDDIAALAKHVGAEQIILGGHDWGGFVVWRCAQWYPKLISHVFAVCTPYTPPHEQYLSLEDLVKGPLPQFGYQIHLASGEVEKSVNDEQSIRQFLKGIYGGRGPNREEPFDPHKGVLVENLPIIGDSRLLNGKILDYYVKEYSRHGIHSTLNWYRTRRANWEEDQGLLDKKQIHTPALFIQATFDSVLKPEMSQSMDQLIPNLTRGEVASTHWALTQKPEEVNAIIRKWLENQGFGTRSSL